MPQADSETRLTRRDQAWFNSRILAGDKSGVAGVELATASEPPARQPRIWGRRPPGVDPSHPDTLSCNPLLNHALVGMVQKRPFSGNTWDLSADPDRSRVGTGLRESLVAVLVLQFRENRVYPRSSSQGACGCPISNSVGLLPTRLWSSLRRYRRWFGKN